MICDHYKIGAMATTTTTETVEILHACRVICDAVTALGKPAIADIVKADAYSTALIWQAGDIKGTPQGRITTDALEHALKAVSHYA